MPREFFIAVGLGLAAALAFLASSFFFGVYIEKSVWFWVSLPGAKLKHFIDASVTPSGAGFFFGSQRQGMQHLFMLVCILLVWVPIFSVVAWGLRHARPKKP
ncbi:MAG: hypothetical protein HY080_05590 [Gammaproteobacteria bacterium]|nr:hypothetical protein [Gammaproteobacteria bacterium]